MLVLATSGCLRLYVPGIPEVRGHTTIITSTFGPVQQWEICATTFDGDNKKIAAPGCVLLESRNKIPVHT